MKAILIIIGVLLVLGAIGYGTTHNYKCHYVTVGNSQVCQ